MSKFFGFLLGVVVALAGPAVFGVLAAEGGIELNAKEMALAYAIGALIFWAVVSFFSGAAALGAFVVFGGMVYAVHWIPNRMTNFLNDVPGVTTGMIEGIKQYTLNGVVPILAAISLVYGIQSIVRSAQRRRRVRAEAERTQREQELAQAQQAAEAAPYQPASPYPVAGGDYQPPAENRYGGYGNSSYDDLFDDEPEPEPVRPRNQADEQTAMFSTSEAAAEEEYEEHEPDTSDETQLVPTDGDATVMVPTTSPEHSDEAEKPAAQEETVVHSQEPVAQGDDSADDETQLTPTSTTAAQAAPAYSAPSVGTPVASTHDAGTTAPAAPTTAEQPTVAAPVEEPSQPSAPTPPAPTAEAPAEPAQPSAAPAESAEPSAAPAAPAQHGGATAVQPAAPETTSAPQAPQAPAPQAPAPQAPAPLPPQAAEPPQAPEAAAPAPQEPAPSAPLAQPSAPAHLAPRPPSSSQTDENPTQETPQAVTPPQTTVDPASAVRAEAVQQREEVGQQYRERMDDSTGEHTFGAFENPRQSDELRPQAPRVMDLPGHFRPAGT